MKIFDLFSKRRKRERGEVIDVYSYDKIPEKLQIQIIHIWRDAIPIDDSDSSYKKPFFRDINEILSREYGIFFLTTYPQEPRYYDYRLSLEQFFLKCEDSEKVLDIIELVFHFIDLEIREGTRVGNIGYDDSFSRHAKRVIKIYPDEAIDELNERFLEHGVGYQFESGQIIRKDSEIIHQEAVKPVLNFLSAPEYKGANEEFLKAHEHYRHQQNKECLNECLKSFESVMKTICDKRNWTYNQNDTAKKLIEICLNNGLIPSYLQTQFTSLKSVLESGVPTARNKTSGHGQGVNQTVVPNYFAHYVMNLTATTILFLVEAEKKLP